MLLLTYANPATQGLNANPLAAPVSSNDGSATLDIFRLLKCDGVVSYCDQICGGGECGQSQICHMGVDHQTKMPAPLCDKYAETIIGDGKDLYDAIEIQGVRNLNVADDPRGTFYEVDNENPQLISVYIRLKEGGVDCVGDFGAYALAEDYARELSTIYSWPVHNFVKAEFRQPRVV